MYFSKKSKNIFKCISKYLLYVFIVCIYTIYIYTHISHNTHIHRHHICEYINYLIKF